MVSSDVLKKIKHIEIYTKRMLSGAMVGDSRSAVKGSGLEFDQIREYQFGDDVRFIDWNASSRANKVLVKQYIEERNRTILLAVDISSSNFFSSSNTLKHDFVAEIASVLALVADYGKDNVGLILFSDQVEAFIPVGTGRNHVRLIMEKLFTQPAARKKTNINVPLEYAAKLKRKDALLIIISDFIATNFEKNLALTAAMYDVVAIACVDKNETHLPNVGFLEVQDSETGNRHILDTRSATLNHYLEQRCSEQERLFKKCGIDSLLLMNNKPFAGDLIRFFRRRMRY